MLHFSTPAAIMIRWPIPGRPPASALTSLPPGLFILIIYSLWRIIVKKADYNTNYKFAAVSFLLIALSTQAYLIGLAGPFVKVLFAENIIILHERFLTFGLFFISMLSAYALYHLTNGKGPQILAVCSIVLIVSVPYYWNRFDKQSVRFTDSELEVIDAFHSMNVYYKYVLYNPLYPRPLGFMVGMGGQMIGNPEDAYMVFNEYRTFSPLNLTYALAARNDSEMTGLISSHPGALKEIYSNKDYVIYEFIEKPGSSNMSLLDSLDIYSRYYNSYLSPKHVKDALSKPVMIMLHNRENNQSLCTQAYSNMTIVPCTGEYDLLVDGDTRVFNYFFLNSFGVIPLVTNSLYLYNNGFISITPGDSMNVSVDIPNKLHRPVDMLLHLYDVGIYAKIHADEKSARIELTKQSSEPAIQLSLHFFARTLAWVDPQPKNSYTYPNILLSVPYAIVMELNDRIRDLF